MKIIEFASAEEQLALWKLVSDNVWSAINQQASAEAEQKAIKKAKAKRVPKGKAIGVPLPPPPVVPPVPVSKPRNNMPPARKTAAKPLSNASPVQRPASTMTSTKSQIPVINQASDELKTALTARKTGNLQQKPA